MLKELLKNREFLKIIENYLKKEGILDIILFGSSIKGKETPNDIDILVLYSKEDKAIYDLVYALRKELEKIYKNIDVVAEKYDDLFSSSFLAREAILSEGFSIKQKKYLAEGFGYTSFTLFKYELKGLSKSRRMQFYYSLYGRGKASGILKKNNCYKFSDSIIFSPIESSEIIKAFFDKWKIVYINFPILMPNKIVQYRLKNDN